MQAFDKEQVFTAETEEELREFHHQDEGSTPVFEGYSGSDDFSNRSIPAKYLRLNPSQLPESNSVKVSQNLEVGFGAYSDSLGPQRERYSL